MTELNGKERNVPTASGSSADAPKIVVVGGGAGGLELVTRLGNALGRRGKAQITLVERNRSHLWKPLLHEVAAGSMDLGRHDVDYLAQSYWHGFRYRYGEMTGLDRAAKRVKIGPTWDEDDRPITEAGSLPYDKLVISVGGLSNDFGTPGAREHALTLDSPDQAARFHRRLLNACIRAQSQAEPLRPEQLHVAIIGAGATGVELAAELHRTTREVVAYGLDRIDPARDLNITVIEMADRVLPGLPPRLSEAAQGLLEDLKVQVLTSSKVSEVGQNGVQLADGRFIAAELVVWAAGVKAPDFLKDLDGLESTRSNQLVVRPTLQTTRDPDVFAFGDCSSCPWVGREGMNVPPRAQAANQQASHLFKQLPRVLRGEAPEPFRYRDFGSLVSLGEYTTVGNLMGSLTGRSLFVEGLFASFMYRSLYKRHEIALHGMAKVVLETLARMITRRTEPQVKLH
ncbi:NAD(P)/FAD-dependent oxidoreductase [Marinivivus vitaminiproducens]|uniref:NAD(P)/FAD-dependent oxidoreductase n=1 Tax=Marinivivus vitaminiproducens TaxID=3035935 RepID=UPI0027A08DED|nr:NAD(P)/FAD-dependent oxidoreductase [Geminicoccaceae bacterium SCSIO 64248]